MKIWKTLLFVMAVSFSCHRYLEPGEKGSYYAYINRAEMAIIKNGLSDALACYRNAFRYKVPGFAADHYNAFKVAVLENDIRFAYFNATHLVRMGYCIDFFESYPLLKEAPEQWQGLIALSQQAQHADRLYRNALDGMMNDDQSARLEGKSHPEINKVDSLNYLKFRKLIEQNGFPAESVIGIECTENMKGIQPQPYDILLTHFAQRRFSGVDSLMDEALKQQALDPYNYVRIGAALGRKKRFLPSPIVKIGDGYYRGKISLAELAEINANRKSIGLPSLEDHIEKILYRFMNPDNGFRLFTPMDVIFDLSEEMVDAHFVKIDINKPVTFQ